MLVCRRWSAVTHTTQSLWTHILLLATSVRPENTLRILQHYFACLRRSGDRFLTVEINGSTQNWGSIIVHVILELSTRRMKSLACVPATFHQIVNFHCTHFIVPLRNLASLDLAQNSITAQAFLDMMPYVSDNLRTGHFHVECRSLLTLSSVRSRNPIIMKRLLALRLRISHPNVNKRWFSAIKYPQLIDLSIEMNGMRWKWDVKQIAAMLYSSGNSLLHLRLYDITPPENLPMRRYSNTSYHEIDGLLDIVPNLRTLVLPLRVDVHASTIEKLASGRFLKQLSHLELASVNGLHILSMIRRRAEHVRCFNLGLGSSKKTVEKLSSLEYIRIVIPWSCHETLAGIGILQRDIFALVGLQCRIRIRLTNELPLAMKRRI